MSAKWLLGTVVVAVVAAGAAVAVTLVVTQQSSKPTNEQMSLVVHTDATEASGSSATASWTVNGTVQQQGQAFYGTEGVYRALVPVGTTAQVTMTNYQGSGWCAIYINPYADSVTSHYKLKVYHRVQGYGTATCVW